MRRIPLVLVALGALAAFPSGASAAGFSLGVSAAEVSSSTALLWAHSTSAGRATVQVSKARTFRKLQTSKSATARKSHDFTLQTRIAGLKPNTTYYYRWQKGRNRSPVGTFKTAPARTSDAPIRFAWSGDADAQPTKGSRSPFYNRFQVYARMLGEHNAFNVNMGDTIYSDSEVPNSGPVATSLKAKWAKYRQNIGVVNLARLRGASAMYNHWDDHEFINDFTKAENGNAIYRAGVSAFRDYMPVTYSSSRGIYRSYRWGKNLEVFFPTSGRSARPRRAPTTRATTRAAIRTSVRPPRSPPATRSLRSTRRCRSRRSPGACRRSTTRAARCWAAPSSPGSPRRYATRRPRSRSS